MYSALLVRSDTDTAARVDAIIRELEPRASSGRVEFASRLQRQLQPSTTGAAIAGAFGGLALLLAAAGTLGVFSYVVSERVGEIGVRLALGARAGHIVRLLVARMSWPLGGGVAVGLLTGMAMSRLIAGRLYWLSPYDLPAYVAVVIVLGATGMLASLIPLRRALGVDPAVTLGHE